MKALIVGASGFVGDYLIDALVATDVEIYASRLPQETWTDPRVQAVVPIDILDLPALTAQLQAIQPDVIYHLAAQSSVKVAWSQPQLTAQINIIGTINLLEAVRQVCPQSKILLVGSSEEYGQVDYTQAVSEATVPNPQNIYAVTKLTQEQIAKIYVNAYQMQIVLTRSFNHIGAKQLPQFVVADFCQQVAAIEKGLQPAVIKVGNLAAARDFTDVRDVVRAYLILMAHGQSGVVYNVGSGVSVKIQTILDLIMAQSTQAIRVEVDSRKFRPLDIPEIRADVSQLKALGWQPQYALDVTIKDILTYWRNHI